MKAKLTTSLMLILAVFLISNTSLRSENLTANAQENLRQYSSTAWSPDGTMIAGSGNHGTVRVWDTDGKLLLDLIGGHPQRSYVGSVAWSPDSSRLASAGTDGTIRIWYIKHSDGQSNPEHNPGALLATLTGHNDAVYDIDWSPDGTRLGSVSYWGGMNIAIWDMGTYTLHESTIGPNAIDIAWSPDSSQFIVGSLIGAYVVNAETFGQADQPDAILDYATALPEVFGQSVPSVAWSTNGSINRIAVSTDDAIHIYNGSTLSHLSQISVMSSAEALSWSTDLSLLAGVNSDTLNIEVWDIATGSLVGALTQADVKQSVTTSIAWSPNNSQIAYGDHSLEIVDTSCLVAPGDGSVPVMRMPCETVTDTIWPTYSWWAADGADWYHVYVSNSASTIRPLGSGGLWVEAAQVCNGDICEYRPVDGLDGTSPSHFGLPNATYEWTIRSLDSTTGVMSEWQPFQGFEVIGPVATLIAPTPSDSVDTGWPTYRWTPVPDADEYRLWVGAQDSTTLINVRLEAADVCDANECQYQTREAYVYGDQYNGQYMWYVQAHHSSADIFGAWQGTTFQTIPTIIISTPVIDSVTSIINQSGRHELTLTWERGAGGDFYYVWLGDAAQQDVFGEELRWVYHEDVCDEEGCRLTVYFDGVAHQAYLGALNNGRRTAWSAPYALTVVEASGGVAASQPPTQSGVTINGFEADLSTSEDVFVPPDTGLPPVDLQVYPDICGDHPQCDSPPLD